METMLAQYLEIIKPIDDWQHSNVIIPKDLQVFALYPDGSYRFVIGDGTRPYMQLLEQGVSQREIECIILQKLDTNETPETVYGVDSIGKQIMYSVDTFGAIKDVKVNGTSVVTNKIANIKINKFEAKAEDVDYDNTQTENNPLTGNNVQDAIDEIVERIDASNDMLINTGNVVDGISDIVQDTILPSMAHKHIRNLENSTEEIIDFPALFAQLDGLVDQAKSIGAEFDSNGAITFIAGKSVSDAETVAISYTPATRILSLVKGDASSIAVTLPQSSSSNAGLMTSEDVVTLGYLRDKVDSLESNGVWRTTFQTYAEMETAYPELDVSGTDWNANDYVYVEEDENRDPSMLPLTSYIVIGDNTITKSLVFRRIEITPIQQATNTVRGIVSGTENTPGKVYVESDGSMSLIGWDILNATINTKVDAINGKELSSNDFTDTLLSKLNGIEDEATANEGTITGITTTSPLLGSGSSGSVALSHESQAIDKAANTPVAPNFGDTFTVIGSATGNETGHITAIKPTAITMPQHPTDHSDRTNIFTSTASRTAIASGETNATIFGKISKWLSDLGVLAFKDTIMNADIATNAAIVQSKLALTGTLQSLANDTIATGVIKKATASTVSVGTIVNTDVSATAAIDQSKLNLTGNLSSLAGNSNATGVLKKATASTISAGAITNADVDSAAAIAGTKLAFDNTVTSWLTALDDAQLRTEGSYSPAAATNVQQALDALSNDAKRFRRRTANVIINISTDDLVANGSQSIAMIINRRMMDNTLFVNNDTVYGLTINITPGTSTTATLRCHGLIMRNAYVDINIQNGVTLAGIYCYYNDVGRLIVYNNATRIGATGSLTGHIIIAYNIARIGAIGYSSNSPTTVAPVAPMARIEQVVTGGIYVHRNIAQTDIYILLGGDTTLGEVDIHGRVNNGTAPAVGTNSAGAINLIYNKAANSVYCVAYGNYDEPAYDIPIRPGAKINSYVYVYYNQCGYDCYFNAHAGYRDGAQTTISNSYVAYNTATRNIYTLIGSSSAIASFNAYFSATATADPSTASRNTVTLSSALLPGQADTIVGLKCTFTNAAITSNAGNYTGTFKTVTAYDPATNTVTLSSNFSQPRSKAATIYFFAGVNTTRLYYGTSVKIERMLQYALAYNYKFSCGLLCIDGNNLSNGFEVVGLDTVNKVVTFQRPETTSGMIADGVYNSVMYVCTLKAPDTYADISSTFIKTGTLTYTGTADLRVRAFLAERVLQGSRKVTGDSILTNTSREIVSASWNVSTPSQLVFGIDSDDGTPVNATSIYTCTLRRVPGETAHNTSNNVSGGSCYAQISTWNIGYTGQLKCYQFNVTGNKCATAYQVVNGYFGVNPNRDSALQVSAIDISSNFATSIYSDIRSNSQQDARGSIGRLYCYSNVCADLYVRISPKAKVERQILIYRNMSGYRIYLGISETISGTTLNQASAPLISHSVRFYDNIAPYIIANGLNIVTAALANHGLALVTYGLNFANCTGGRIYIESANMWIDVTNSATPSVTAPVGGISVTNTSGFELLYAISIQTTAALYKYGIIIMNCRNIKIGQLLGIMQTMLMYGEVAGTVINTIDALSKIWKVSPDPGTITAHSAGVGPDVNLVQNKTFLGAI